MLGIGAEWISWRLRLPSILVLLVVGVVAGPITGILDPRTLFSGGVLAPIVAISVAIILFEGTLSLKLTDLRQIGGGVRNLVTIGVLVTWGLAAVAAHFTLGFSWSLALLLGTIATVTGPTVIVPLLRQIRPVGRVGSIARWERIVIDPVGAVLAILVFDVIFQSRLAVAAEIVAIGLLVTVAVGIVLGLLGAGLIVLMLRQYWVSDQLQSPFALMVVVGLFVASNEIREESGLVTATLMGVLLANQRWASIKQIVEFKENLRVLLISGLFILLASQIRLSDLSQLGAGTVVFIAALIVVVRPISVAVSSLGSGLSWREQVFLASLAPRGIVAAAVMFAVIAATVTIYGLAAGPIARLLGLAQPNPQGLFFIGAHPWAREMAKSIEEAVFVVKLIDTNRAHVSAARLAGLGAHTANIHSESVLDDLDLGGIGRVVAMTSNDEVNSLACLHYAPSSEA